MIYLFTNRTFGEPFLRTALRWAEEHRPITVVLSARRHRVRGALRRVAARAKLGLTLRRERRRLGRELGHPVLLVDNVNARRFAGRIRPHDHGVIAGFDQIFKAPTITAFATLVNFHPSLLPYYRGPIPAHWCLANGESRTGFSLHRVTERIDAGEVLSQEVVPIEAGDDVAALTRRVAEAAQPTFERYLHALESGGSFETRRVDAGAIYRVRVDYASFPTAPE